LRENGQFLVPGIFLAVALKIGHFHARLLVLP